jgi:hypothetical protein
MNSDAASVLRERKNANRDPTLVTY